MTACTRQVLTNAVSTVTGYDDNQNTWRNPYTGTWLASRARLSVSRLSVMRQALDIFASLWMLYQCWAPFHQMTGIAMTCRQFLNSASEHSHAGHQIIARDSSLSEFIFGIVHAWDDIMAIWMHVPWPRHQLEQSHSSTRPTQVSHRRAGHPEDQTFIHRTSMGAHGLGTVAKTQAIMSDQICHWDSFVAE